MAETLPKHRLADKAKQEAKRDIRAELDRLEVKMNELKLLFEQYFSGILPLPPDKLHNEIKREIRGLLKAPFRNSAMNYRLKSLEGRYHTFNTYWQRVLKQRENGTYSKDVFKAELRERITLAEARAQTAVGAAERRMEGLFNTYRSALEKVSGTKHNIDYDNFEKSLIKRAQDFKEKHGAEKLSFKVVVKEGKVSVQIKAKKEAQEKEHGGKNQSSQSSS